MLGVPEAHELGAPWLFTHSSPRGSAQGDSRSRDNQRPHILDISNVDRRSNQHLGRSPETCGRRCIEVSYLICPAHGTVENISFLYSDLAAAVTRGYLGSLAIFLADLSIRIWVEGL